MDLQEMMELEEEAGTGLINAEAGNSSVIPHELAPLKLKDILEQMEKDAETIRETGDSSIGHGNRAAIQEIETLLHVLEDESNAETRIREADTINVGQMNPTSEIEAGMDLVHLGDVESRVEKCGEATTSGSQSTLISEILVFLGDNGVVDLEEEEGGHKTSQINQEPTEEESTIGITAQEVSKLTRIVNQIGDDEEPSEPEVEGPAVFLDKKELHWMCEKLNLEEKTKEILTVHNEIYGGKLRTTTTKTAYLAKCKKVEEAFFRRLKRSTTYNVDGTIKKKRKKKINDTLATDFPDLFKRKAKFSIEDIQRAMKLDEERFKAKVGTMNEKLTRKSSLIQEDSIFGHPLAPVVTQEDQRRLSLVAQVIELLSQDVLLLRAGPSSEPVKEPVKAFKNPDIDDTIRIKQSSDNVEAPITGGELLDEEFLAMKKFLIVAKRLYIELNAFASEIKNTDPDSVSVVPNLKETIHDPVVVVPVTTELLNIEEIKNTDPDSVSVVPNLKETIHDPVVVAPVTTELLNIEDYPHLAGSEFIPDEEESSDEDDEVGNSTDSSETEAEVLDLVSSSSSTTDNEEDAHVESGEMIGRIDEMDTDEVGLSTWTEIEPVEMTEVAEEDSAVADENVNDMVELSVPSNLKGILTNAIADTTASESESSESESSDSDADEDDQESSCTSDDELELENVFPSEANVSSSLDSSGSSVGQPNLDSSKTPVAGPSSAVLDKSSEIMTLFEKLLNIAINPGLTAKEARLVSKEKGMPEELETPPLLEAKPTINVAARAAYNKKYGLTTKKYNDLWEATNPSLALSREYASARNPGQANGLLPVVIPDTLGTKSSLMDLYINTIKKKCYARENPRMPNDGVFWGPTKVKGRGSLSVLRPPGLNTEIEAKNTVLKVEFYAHKRPSKKIKRICNFKPKFRKDTILSACQDSALEELPLRKALMDAYEKRMAIFKRNEARRERRRFRKVMLEAEGKVGRPPLVLEMEVLGSKTVQELGECLKCERDCLIDTPLTPDEALRAISTPILEEELPKKSLICLIVGQTVFCDLAEVGSEKITKATEYIARGLSRSSDQNGGPSGTQFEYKSWDSSLNTLNLRFGFPYFIFHRDSCSHKIIFTQCRACDAGEEELLQKNSKVLRLYEFKRKFCSRHRKTLARFATRREHAGFLTTEYHCNACVLRGVLLLKSLEVGLIGSKEQTPPSQDTNANAHPAAAASQQQPATSQQQPATSQQQPATSQQQPAKSKKSKRDILEITHDYIIHKYKSREIFRVANLVTYLSNNASVTDKRVRKKSTRPRGRPRVVKPKPTQEQVQQP